MRNLTFAVFFLSLLTGPLFAETYPDRMDRYLNDYADVLTPAQEQTIREKLVELMNERDVEFTVLTINSMFNYGHGGQIEPYATDLFNTWGIGDAERNDGLLMLISVEDRLMRIEVGSGYGLSLNDPMKTIIDRDFTPKFKTGLFFEGIDAGVSEVIQEVTGTWPGEFQASGSEKMFNASRRWFDRLGAWIYALLVPVFGGLTMLIRRWQRNRPRRCPHDGSKMERIDEDWDDQHLQPGQITEEKLKSVDYDVWQCMRCDHQTIEAYKGWFSRYSACRSCGNKTVESDTTVLEYATTSSTGLKRIDYSCLHCKDHWSLRKTIPRKSSSSSSSGGSSGGGSSSGGGASGSW